MNKKMLLLLTVIISSITSFLVAEEVTQNGIIFIVDQQNLEYTHKTNPAETSNLLNALKNAVPILVSQSVVANYLTDSQFTHIKNQDWIIKEIDNYYLLLPKKGLLQAQAGLKLDNLPEVSIDLTQHVTKQEYEDRYGNPLEGKPKKAFVEILKQLFIVKSELTQGKELVVWTILFFGHGYTNKSIADLSIDEFKGFLNFLEKKIAVKLLVYSSCFAGGSNKIKAFQEQEKERFKDTTYPFPIILLSVGEFTTHTEILDNSNFDGFFNRIMATNNKLPNYYQILTETNMLPTLKSVERLDLANFPQIRLPGLEWFSVAALNNAAHSTAKELPYLVVSDVMATTKTDALLVNGNKQALFIYSPTVPFPISFQEFSLNTFLPHIFYMLPAPHAYHFKELYAPNHTLKGLLSFGFSQISVSSLKYGPDSLTYIDKLTVLRNFENPQLALKFNDSFRRITLKDCIMQITEQENAAHTERINFYATAVDKDHKEIKFKAVLGLKDKVFIQQEDIIDFDYLKKFPAVPPFDQLKKSLDPLLQDKLQQSLLLKNAGKSAITLISGLKLKKKLASELSDKNEEVIDID
jgi:hypothetical protein